jgi:hypothetical protein
MSNENDSKTKIQRYLEIRLTTHAGHREASRLAGYQHTAPLKAARSYKFVQEVQPRSRSNDPKPSEIEQFLLQKLELLNARMEALREEMKDVRLKMTAWNIAQELKGKQE